ncbi:hypothetical protein ABI59_11230 [Acidobacteria bacterium Mor1]|nr:hypothetical protein ABI59_11230 [Acidobacteria bacterium Mor1]
MRQPGNPASPLRDAADIAVLVVITATAVVVAQALDPASPAGNRAAMAGVLAAIGWAFLATRLRRERVGALGVGRPDSWPRTLGLAVAGTVVLFVVGILVQAVVLPLFLKQATPETSRFDAIRGNLPVLVRTLAVVWTTAAFGEEVVYRGFLLPRLERLFGGGRLAALCALLVGAVGFGLLHLYQGPAGVIVTGWTGIALGAIYYLNRRNIWAAVIAHGLTHLISFGMLYAGLLPG